MTILLASALIILGMFWIVFSYNRLVALTTNTESAWADVEVQLKRRYDLIPNILTTVQAYALHEQKTLEKVIQAREKTIRIKNNPTAKGEAERVLSSTLGSLFVLAEAYPNLKANSNFIDLQAELVETENKIQHARRFYNGNVKILNTTIGLFPLNLSAIVFGFRTKEFFQLKEEVAKEPVKIKI